VRVPCVGAVISDGNGRIVVIRRARPPSAGMWSIPGGRVEAGESLEQAARREVQEETGLDVAVGTLLGRVDITAGVDTYDVYDFAAVAIDGTQALVAGDDASDARWVSQAEFGALQTVPGLVESLATWQVWSL